MKNSKYYTFMDNFITISSQLFNTNIASPQEAPFTKECLKEALFSCRDLPKLIIPDIYDKPI